MKYNTVKNFKQLFALPRKEEGDIIYCEEEKRAYTYKDGVWEPCTISGEGLSLSLYDLNAQAMESLPTASEEFLNEMAEHINTYALDSQNIFFMLMCKEQSYYTVLKHTISPSNEFSTLGEAVITLAKELGEIKDIYLNEDKTDFDIWVKVEDTMWCLHLFAYDIGVVCYG